MAALLKNLSIELVLTAHPTEAARRSILVKLNQVADLLGHSTAVTTMSVYAHSDDERKQDAVEKLRQAITSG